ncbi:MAG: hypothetical protein D6681_09545 [Calditrichaeota bacterium]|nr:MAG: hypothetical protein D6681_09545 [Calditrichota bacterium]
MPSVVRSFNLISTDCPDARTDEPGIGIFLSIHQGMVGIGGEMGRQGGSGDDGRENMGVFFDRFPAADVSVGKATTLISGFYFARVWVSGQIYCNRMVLRESNAGMKAYHK